MENQSVASLWKSSGHKNNAARVIIDAREREAKKVRGRFPLPYLFSTALTAESSRAMRVTK
jgi:hypothetical protein